MSHLASGFRTAPLGYGCGSSRIYTSNDLFPTFFWHSLTFFASSQADVLGEILFTLRYTELLLVHSLSMWRSFYCLRVISHI